MTESCGRCYYRPSSGLRWLELELELEHGVPRSHGYDFHYVLGLGLNPTRAAAVPPSALSLRPLGPRARAWVWVGHRGHEPRAFNGNDTKGLGPDPATKILNIPITKLAMAEVFRARRYSQAISDEAV